MDLVILWRLFRAKFACSLFFVPYVFATTKNIIAVDVKAKKKLPIASNISQPPPNSPSFQPPTAEQIYHHRYSTMDKPLAAKETPGTTIGKPVYLTSKRNPDTTVITFSPRKASRERDNLQMPPSQYFTTKLGGAEDQGISQERSEALANFYNDIIGTIRSTTHAAVLKATQKIAKSTSKEEAHHHGQVMTDAIEAAACNAARRGVSEALQEHPTCEVCKRYYYEGRGPKHPQHDPQDRLFKCVKWPCKKWYHVGCMNIKYEMKDTYMCLGKFAPCVETVARKQTTTPFINTAAVYPRNQIPNTNLTNSHGKLPQSAPATIMAPPPIRTASSLSARQPTTTKTQTSTTTPFPTQPFHPSLLYPHQTNRPPPPQNPTPSSTAPIRMAATKGFQKCRGDGLCAKFTHAGNLPARCVLDGCGFKPLCSACRESGRGVRDGERWFCCEECWEMYTDDGAVED